MAKPNLNLYFGPYTTPRYRYGQVVMDECYGEVKIVGTSDAPIPWPMHQRSGQRIPVLYRGLAKAVRTEMFQAVQHHWHVSTWTVNRWRKALGVPTSNKALHLVRVAHGKKHAKQFVESVRSSLSDPKRAAKIAASMRGNRRPAHIARALRKAWLGRKHTAAARQKMSIAQRRRGTRPPAAGVAWTAVEDALLGKFPPKEVAKRTERSLAGVYSRRSMLGINDGRSARHT